jgi:hypothetical protein
MSQSWPYNHLTAPALGNGVSFNIVEATLTRGITRGWKGEALISTALARLQALAVSLSDDEGQPITSEPEQRKQLQRLADGLLRERLPALVRLGTLPQRHGGGTEIMENRA